jgi:hypothetical protein
MNIAQLHIAYGYQMILQTIVATIEASHILIVVFGE